DPTRLVPVERHPVAFPRDLREEERRQAAELLERYARLTAGHDGHGWSSPGCSLHSKQRARHVHRFSACARTLRMVGDRRSENHSSGLSTGCTTPAAKGKTLVFYLL